MTQQETGIYILIPYELVTQEALKLIKNPICDADTQAVLIPIAENKELSAMITKKAIADLAVPII